MTPDDALTKIEAQLAAATPGPWRVRRACWYSEDAEFIEHSRTDIELLLAVAEASSRFRHFADQINAYIANPTAGQDAAKGAWLEGLHAAQADVDAALDALDAAP